MNENLEKIYVRSNLKEISYFFVQSLRIIDDNQSIIIIIIQSEINNKQARRNENKKEYNLFFVYLTM